MKIALSRRIQRQLERAPIDLRQQLAEAVKELPQTLSQPHRHAGLGIRKIHRRGVFELRLSRQCRVVFTQPEKDLVMLHLLGNHDDVQRFLDSL
jgi:mRNA-degrading endonuclease RelE of RelBE toxin-antitoxin system